MLRQRLGPEARIEAVPYGQAVKLGSARISLHPAGHIPGSAQVRVEHRGEVWVVSGDSKLEPDPTCPPFEPLRCFTFLTESTFGLPVYRWPGPAAVCAEIDAWWLAAAGLKTRRPLFVSGSGAAHAPRGRSDRSQGRA